MFVVQLGFLFLLNFPDLTFVMLMFHLLTYNPNWNKHNARQNTATIFYDGHCGLCHGVVRFVLAEDQNGAFQFSPLQGAMFERTVNKEIRESLPDTFVIVTPDKQLLVEGKANLYSYQNSKFQRFFFNLDGGDILPLAKVSLEYNC